MEVCDSCGARALNCVYVTAESFLLFCNHHWYRHQDLIEHRGYIVEVLAPA